MTTTTTRPVQARTLDVGDRLLFPIWRLVEGRPTIVKECPATVTQKAGGMAVRLDEDARPVDVDACWRIMPHDSYMQIVEVS